MCTFRYDSYIIYFSQTCVIFPPSSQSPDDLAACVKTHDLPILRFINLPTSTHVFFAFPPSRSLLLGFLRTLLCCLLLPLFRPSFSAPGIITVNIQPCSSISHFKNKPSSPGLHLPHQSQPDFLKKQSMLSHLPSLITAIWLLLPKPHRTALVTVTVWLSIALSQTTPKFSDFKQFINLSHAAVVDGNSHLRFLSREAEVGSSWAWSHPKAQLSWTSQDSALT